MIPSLTSYQKSNIPFAVKTSETYYIHLSSETHIEPLENAPEEFLSRHAVSKDVDQ